MRSSEIEEDIKRTLRVLTHKTEANKQEQDKWKHIITGMIIGIGMLWSILVYQLNSTMAEVKNTIEQQIVTQTDIEYIKEDLARIKASLNVF